MDEITFRLGRQQHTLRTDMVEETLEHVSPKEIKTYYVIINGKRFPVKQALSVALNKPLATFISTDAYRIFATLGFQVGIIGDGQTYEKTYSELLFEACLLARGHRNFVYQKQFNFTLKRPDYALPFHAQEIVFDVKEFVPTEDNFQGAGRAFDPYNPVRWKIHKAFSQFQDFAGYPCCLVLYNRDKPLVRLEWIFVYGAMLGDLTLEMPIDTVTGMQTGKTLQKFGQRGKVLEYENGRRVGVRNSALSAIIVLEHFPVGQRRLGLEARRREGELGRELGFDEYWKFIEEMKGTECDVSLRELRVVVHENPHATNPLSRELFRGPYDERYELVEDRIRRVFVGHELEKLESNEKAVETPAATDF